MTVRGQTQPVEISTVPLWQKAALLCVGYFTSAWLGRALSAGEGTIVSYWLPCGVFVAALLLCETREWPWLILSAVVANILFDALNDDPVNIVVILLFCVANVLQAGIGAWLMRQFVAYKPLMASLREFFGLMFFSGALGSAVGATIAATMAVRFHLSDLPFVSNWETIWGGDFMAVLVVAPMLLVFLGDRQRLPDDFFRTTRVLEALAVFGGLAGCSWYYLVVGGGINSPKAPMLALVLWAGLRFGLRGATLAVFFLAVCTAFLTTHYLQGLSKADIAAGKYVFTLQLFVAVAALVGMVPAIVLAERDRTLAQLRESEGKFSKAFRASPDVMSITDLETGRYIEVNDAHEKIFGLKREAVMGHSPLELGIVNDSSTRDQLMKKLRESGSLRNVEIEARTADGRPLVMLHSAELMTLGGRACALRVSHDITESKRTGQALRESMEKFAKAFRASPDGLSITNLKTGRYIEFNEGYCRLYGYSRDEMFGRTSIELGIWENTKERDGFLESLKKTGTARDVEVRTRTRQGELKIVQISAEPIELEGNSCIVSVSHDVTDRIRAEEANHLQRDVLEMIASGRPMQETLEALLRMIEAQSNDMLCSILLVGADGLHVRHVAAPSLPADFINGIDGQVIGPCAGSCGTAAYRREPVFVADIASDPLWAAYREMTLPYGLRACWSTPIFDSDKKVLGTFAIYHHVPGLPGERQRQLISMVTHTAAICISRHRAETEREQAVVREQQARIGYTLQLIASQEAERKRIAAELHDSMGQNLLLIKNMAELALRSKAPEQAYEQLGTINHLTAQCIAEARQISRDLRPLQLDHLGLKRALEAMLDQASQASEVQITYKFEPVDGLFSGEAALNLYRVVQESLNNVMKHARARHVNVRLERDIHEVQLQIEDDGAGFVLESIGEQKGLGLRNITERVRMLGGKLNIDSAPGQGTRIVVTIPIAENPA